MNNTDGKKQKNTPKDPKSIENFITKISIQSFAIERKINDLISSENLNDSIIKELNSIKDMISKNDKEILSFFEVKLSSKEKEKVFSIMNLMK
jgi:hypothetical protein